MFVTACWNFTLATRFQRKVVADVVRVQEESRGGTAAEQGRCWGGPSALFSFPQRGCGGRCLPSGCDGLEPARDAPGSALRGKQGNRTRVRRQDPAVSEVKRHHGGVASTAVSASCGGRTRRESEGRPSRSKSKCHPRREFETRVRRKTQPQGGKRWQPQRTFRARVRIGSPTAVRERG
jgi:hypothetical protein